MRISIIFLLLILFSSQSHSEVDDWSSYGKDSGGGHYSRATEINPENVKNLKKVWTHRSGDYHQGANWTEDVTPNSSQQTSFQATPLLVNETLYYCTPYNRVFALDSETGEEKWTAKRRGIPLLPSSDDLLNNLRFPTTSYSSHDQATTLPVCLPTSSPKRQAPGYYYIQTTRTSCITGTSQSEHSNSRLTSSSTT